MSSFFSSDGSFSLQFAIIFVVIFLILAGAVFAFRRLTGKGMTLSSKAGPRGRQPRLGIVDIYELDRQRQLILLRRDNVEHLLLVGGPNDVVIERNINRTMGARLPAEDLPDPDAFPDPVPAATYEPKPAPYLEPSFEMPVVVPPPPVPQAPIPQNAIPQAPAPRVAEPRIDMSVGREPEPIAEPAEAPAARRAPSRLSGAIRRTPPSLVNLVPGAAAMRARLADEDAVAAPDGVEPSVAEGRSQPDVDGAAPDSTAPAATSSVVTPSASRTIDAAILSDMARQLEEALRRPSAAVRSSQPARVEPDLSPSVAEPPVAEPAASSEMFVPAELHPASEPASELPSEPPAIDPIAAAMAASPENPGAPDHPSATATPELEGLFDERDAEPAPFMAPSAPAEPEPVHDAPSPPVFVEAPPELLAPEPLAPEPPAPAPKPPAPEPAAAPPVPSKPAQTSPNPFSVEEIEAEFARLLGRPLDRKN